MKQSKYNIERHPLEPFLPEEAKVLMLGSFPPQKGRWSMDFFYPNRQNDMWRIMGFIFFRDKDYFYLTELKTFNRERIIEFCRTKGIAIYDAAFEVQRLKNNASDKFLEVITPSDIRALLKRLPHCYVIITTGQKATDILTQILCCRQPAIGNFTRIFLANREFHLWRMPSTSRAYPLAFEKKVEYYRNLFIEEKLLL